MSGMPWLVISALATARNNLPCLETLSLDTWEQLGAVNIFEFAPKLRALYLGPQIQPLDVHVPWSQLTHLRANTNVDKWHAVLTLVPNIVTLDVQLSTGWGDVTPTHTLPYPIIQLSQLTKLTLSPSSNLGQFFNYLSLPMLRDLCYEGEFLRWSYQQFIALLSRSSCSLRSLTINNSDLREDELGQILEHTPELIEFRLGTCDIPLTANTMSRLMYQKVPCLVPKLRYLDFYWDVRFDHRGFVDMIESRWRLEESTISRIQTVKVRKAVCLDRLALIRCRQLLFEGLNLQLMVGDDQPLDYDSLLKSL